MKTIRIKTHNLNFPHDTNHFFILSKGYNAGKPMDKPCPNCFIVMAENEEHKYQLFWVCYGLWKSGAYLPILCGSVIPFVHIRDASSLIDKAFQNVNKNKTKFEKEVGQLQQLIRAETLLNKQINLIAEIKGCIARKMLEVRDA
jgi:hypothetical protein